MALLIYLGKHNKPLKKDENGDVIWTKKAIKEYNHIELVEAIAEGLDRGISKKETKKKFKEKSKWANKQRGKGKYEKWIN